jgi:hypothetical protein
VTLGHTRLPGLPAYDDSVKHVLGGKRKQEYELENEDLLTELVIKPSGPSS